MMKIYTNLLLLFLLSFCTVAQTVKRSKVVSKGTITGMAYHPNVGMAITHGDGYVGFPALNGQDYWTAFNSIFMIGGCLNALT